MTEPEAAAESLTCPGCGKQIASTLTLGKSDSVTLVCPGCKERSQLGKWRPASPSVAAPLPEDRFVQFPLYREMFEKPGSGTFVSRFDTAWGTAVSVLGFFVVLGGLSTFTGAASGYPRGDSVIAELQAIRGVLLLILGGKMISWGNKQWKEAAAAKSKIAS